MPEPPPMIVYPVDANGNATGPPIGPDPDGMVTIPETGRYMAVTGHAAWKWNGTRWVFSHEVDEEWWKRDG